MANKRNQILRTYHSAARADYSLVILPVLMIPLVVWALIEIPTVLEAEKGLEWYWFAGAIGALLLFPLWAKIKALLFSRFRVTTDAVLHEHGLISRSSSEIRIQDIRNVVVNQGVLDRIFMVGDISFSSAAGDFEEVQFSKVSRPNLVKEFVKELQRKLSDGVLDDQERAELDEIDRRGRGKKKKAAAEPTPEATPAPARKKQAPAAAPAASDDGDDRDELYRLLAQQEAEGVSDEGEDAEAEAEATTDRS